MPCSRQRGVSRLAEEFSAPFTLYSNLPNIREPKCEFLETHRSRSGFCMRTTFFLTRKNLSSSRVSPKHLGCRHKWCCPWNHTATSSGDDYMRTLAHCSVVCQSCSPACSVRLGLSSDETSTWYDYRIPALAARNVQSG